MKLFSAPSTAQIKGRVTRLRVFAEVKRVMDEEGRCPTASEVAISLEMSHSAVALHMAALRGADGLPLPIEDGRRNYSSRGEDAKSAWRASNALMHLRLGRRTDENNIPVDILLREGV